MGKELYLENGKRNVIERELFIKSYSNKNYWSKGYFKLIIIRFY